MSKDKFITEDIEDQAPVIQFLDDRIYEYNAAETGKHDGAPFTKVVRDENGHIIAGITGWAWAAVSEITLFWVHKDHRGQGIGKRLLISAEEDALKKGCRMMLLRSYSFQAPGFYLANGYEEVFVLQDFPEGHQSHFLIKKFA